MRSTKEVFSVAKASTSVANLMREREQEQCDFNEYCTQVHVQAIENRKSGKSKTYSAEQIKEMLREGREDATLGILSWLFPKLYQNQL